MEYKSSLSFVLENSTFVVFPLILSLAFQLCSLLKMFQFSSFLKLIKKKIVMVMDVKMGSEFTELNYVILRIDVFYNLHIMLCNF